MNEPSSKVYTKCTTFKEHMEDSYLCFVLRARAGSFPNISHILSLCSSGRPINQICKEVVKVVKRSIQKAYLISLQQSR